MFTMALGLGGQAQHKEPVSTKSVRVGALLGALVLTSIAVNALIVVADSTVRKRSSASDDCSAITERAERLTCFDNLARPACTSSLQGRQRARTQRLPLTTGCNAQPTARPSCITPARGAAVGFPPLILHLCESGSVPLDFICRHGDLTGLERQRSAQRSWKMLPFVASQAVALSQAKREASKAGRRTAKGAAPRTGKGFFSMLFDALVESRKRQAAMEIQRQRRLRGEARKK